jgi:Pyruvate/2-oxoacid:ferredoxin oxidoreductase gamma subunit
MLGSLIKAWEIVKKDSFLHPLQERFGRIAVKNIAAFERAYQDTILIQ